jgi:hypothetical protein
MYREFQEVALTSLVKNILLISIGIALVILLSSIGYEIFVKIDNHLSNKLVFTTALISVLTYSIYAYFPKIRMEINVNSEFIDVKIGFLTHKRYSRAKLVQAHEIEFQPIADFGGYGYRINSSKRALIAKGNQGVELLFEDGSIIIIGTDNPEEFLLTLNTK